MVDGPGTTLGTVHSPLLATTKRRRSRITPRQEAALTSGSHHLLRLDGEPPRLIPTVDDVLDPALDLILDIGFGTGQPVEEAAQREPTRGIIAVDLHTPGIGDLIYRTDSQGLTNVVVIEADVREVVPLLPILAGARTYFPDPWPKKRHHRRRLISEDFTAALAQRVQPGGFWHLATDWPDYAEHIEQIVGGRPEWAGGVIDRPAHRPVTRYEQYAQQAGREAIDLWFERVTS